MKSTTMMSTELADSAIHSPDASATRLFAPIARAYKAVQAARADRAMRAELATLDDALLRDIGIDHDEIYRIRARERFTPRAWRA